MLSSLVAMTTWSFYMLMTGRIEKWHLIPRRSDISTKHYRNVSMTVFFEARVCLCQLLGVTSL